MMIVKLIWLLFFIGFRYLFELIFRIIFNFNIMIYMKNRVIYFSYRIINILLFEYKLKNFKFRNYYKII